MIKKTLCLLLIGILTLSFPLTVFADEPIAETEPAASATLRISSPTDFLTFAENCRLDTYSQNLNVILETDIDLSGTDFQGIPIFSGSFNGNGHTISGLSITCSGSYLGLFRYLTANAAVKDLTVTGSLHPQGSRSYVGGIAGSNAGSIENCRFEGELSGNDYVGGIAGTNEVTGTISECRAEGDISGNHFVGGIAGSNTGVIRACVNSAGVNTAARQNEVEISDITLDSLTDTEASNTATDIGGIAGTSSGVIRSCENLGAVGYPHMGYNIGGIAGSQSGYLVDSKNSASVSGRKDVGGIVGQIEPVTNIRYTVDTLQILRQQLNTLAELTDQASANAQNALGSINSQISILQDHIANAQDAVTGLMPNGQFPDADSIQAAWNTLSASLRGMQSSLQAIVSAAQNASGTLSGDLKAISDQVSAMGETINGAGENLGGSFTDVSDADSPDDLAGKVEGCTNHGSILADLNAGGIAGAMAPENDLDPEDDILLSGEASLNFAGELRCVILRCENTGTVTVKKQNAGGIAGWMPLGLVKDGLNTGTLSGEAADYIGGIAGQSAGFLRFCYANCQITGDSYTGGIAGTASTLSDCRSMVLLEASERKGSIVGYAEDLSDITGNYYLSADADIGAIDGISYHAIAQPLPKDDFLALENLPKIFHIARAHFLFDDGSILAVSVPLGQPLEASAFPDIPEKEGYISHWDGPTDWIATFDTTYTAVYTPLTSVIQSQQTDPNGKPLLLAEGSFAPNSLIPVSEAAASVPLEARQTLVDSLSFTLPESKRAVTVRCLLPEGTDAEALQLMMLTKDGWQGTSFTTDGSYLVFSALPGDVQIALVETQSLLWLWLLLSGVGVLGLLTGTVALIRRKAKNKTGSGSEGSGDNCPE